MKIDRAEMIANFLAEMAELNKPSKLPSRQEIEEAFVELLQHNVVMGAYDQAYCDTVAHSVAMMDDQSIFSMYQTMKKEFPELEV
jgi:hypothetical protein